MNDQISPGRKAAYYGRMAITLIGVLMFLSVFFTRSIDPGPAIGGMALMVIGKVISSIGARGLAGSGVLLNPKQAREDLKPYSTMAGGMLGDALNATGIPDQLGKRGERVVMLKCTSCGKLNEEDSKFCQECGEEI